MTIANGARRADAYPIAANDNDPRIRDYDVPVFDRGKVLVSLFAKGEWSPPKQPRKRGQPIRLEGDGPTLSRRINTGIAWYSSSKWRDRPSGDNQNWPLGGLLKTEQNDGYLALANRYRALVDACQVELRGTDVDNIYVLDQKSTLDPSTGKINYKGAKTLTGKRAKPEAPATRTDVADPDITKKKGKPMPRKWQGDWPLLHKMDSEPVLSHLRRSLGPIRDAFEAAVVSGDKLETIGRDHWVGNLTGAKGAGRALVFLGFQVVERAWREYKIDAARKASRCKRLAEEAGLT